MSASLGSCLALLGGLEMFDVINRTVPYLNNNVQQKSVNDTKYKQVARIVANALHIIGLFCSAMALISMGATLITLGPQMAFLTAVGLAIETALPYLIGSLGALSSGLIIRQLAS